MHCNEQLHVGALARCWVHQMRPLARVVDEQLLARAMLLAHDQTLLLEPLSVDFAELCVTQPIRVALQVLLVQNLQGYARSFAFHMDVRRVWHRPRSTCRCTRTI